MTKRISKAIDIFLNAIENNTLIKGNCSECAVSNLVENGLGIEVDIENNFPLNSFWIGGFCTDSNKQIVNEKYFNDEDFIKNIKATDFSIKELMKIEYAFETNTKLYNKSLYNKNEIRDDLIKGLEAVIQIMMDFDDVKDSIYEVFTSKAKLISI